MYNQVIDFINTNNLLSKQQFGFRKHHSTNHAVITLIDKISAVLDSGKAVVSCYIDLKKAFTKSTLLKLYNSFVLPCLIYCVQIWGNASEIHILPIRNLKKNIRALTFSSSLAHTKNIFICLKILPFKKLVIHRIAIQMFKYNNRNIPKALSELFTPNS